MVCVLYVVVRMFVYPDRRVLGAGFRQEVILLTM